MSWWDRFEIRVLEGNGRCVVFQYMASKGTNKNPKILNSFN